MVAQSNVAECCMADTPLASLVKCVEKPTDNTGHVRRLFRRKPGDWGLKDGDCTGGNMRGGADECHAEPRTI